MDAATLAPAPTALSPWSCLAKGGGPLNGTRLVAFEELNGAHKSRAILDCCLAVLTCCSDPVFLVCCLTPPNVQFGLEGDASGRAGYTLMGHTFCVEACSLRGMPDGAVINFASDTDIGKKRDMVIAMANYIGKRAASPDTA